MPTDEELHKLGEDLVDWAKNVPKDENGKPKDLRCLWGLWYCCKHGYILRDWKLIKKLPIFRPYYEQARNYMSQHFINGDIKEGIAHRFLRHFIPEEVKEEEDELLVFKSDLAKKEAEHQANLCDLKEKMDKGEIAQI